VSDEDLAEIERHLKVLERATPAEHTALVPVRTRLERAALPRFLAWLTRRGLPTGTDARAKLEAEAQTVVADVAQTFTPRVSDADVHMAAQNLAFDVLGAGPIQLLLDDPDVTEVMVNGPDVVLVERNGKIVREDVRFRDAEHLTLTVRRIAERIDRQVDYAHPVLNARLADGSRVHAIIPPIALEGPVLTIRKYRPMFRQIEDLVSTDTIRPEMAYYLGACVKARLNIAIGGPSASGKTTTLNVLASQIPQGERVVTIEELSELDLTRAHGHIVRLQARPDNNEGVGEVTIRHLVREALRMRADRVIVGEARGSEMLDVLQAMRCGHDGSMTTIHATSAEDLVERAITISMLGNPTFNEPFLQRMIVEGLDLVVILDRFSDGTRKVVKITEPYRDEAGAIRWNDVFAFDHEGYDASGHPTGKFRSTGKTRFLARFARVGLSLPASTFEPFR
jgi:pilus assembly protein CpaF